MAIGCNGSNGSQDKLTQIGRCAMCSNKSLVQKVTGLSPKDRRGQSAPQFFCPGCLLQLQQAVESLRRTASLLDMQKHDRKMKLYPAP